MLYNRKQVSPQPTLNQCIECKAPGPRNEWLMFNVEVSQGPRGVQGTAWSVTPTFIINQTICPKCLYLPKYLGLREIFASPESLTGLPNYDDKCIVICRTTYPYGYHKPRVRHRRVRCPNCWRRKANVHSIDEDLPIPVMRIWWDAVTEIDSEGSNEPPEPIHPATDKEIA